MRILSLTHGPLVRAELFGDVAREEGDELVEWEITTRGVPPANGYDAVMVFGGHQNVGEELEHPWLHDEYELLRRWVDDGMPLLGVCLGAQTLSHAVGGVVSKAPAPLAGFYETELTEAGVADPVLGVLPQRFEALNGNAHRFTIPPDAIELARGPVPQAFRVGERAWAVQFHPEVRHEQVLAWWREEEDELPRPLAELEAELDAKLAGWQELGRRLCRAFLSESRRTRSSG
jgi:GMP synthase-like glutamine amidotransferase